MSERWDRLVEKYGGEEAARAEMRRRADKSSRNKGGKFNATSEEAAQEARRKGGFNRAAKLRALKEQATTSQNHETDSKTEETHG